jgi:hypothetical protein
MLMRTGRPIAPLSLTVEERETLERWARRPKSAQALAHCPGVRGGPAQHGGGHEARADPSDGRQMAPALGGAAAGRVAGRTASRGAAPGR